MIGTSNGAGRAINCCGPGGGAKRPSDSTKAGPAEIGGRPFNDFGLVTGGNLVSGFLVTAWDLLGAATKRVLISRSNG